MSFSQKFSKYIKEQLHEQGISVSTLATLVEVSVAHMYDLLGNRKRWNQDVIDKLCEVLNIEILFQKAF